MRWQAEHENDDTAVGQFIEDRDNNNYDNKNIDLSTVKVTDLKYNRRLYAPKAAKHKLETNLQQTRSALEEVFNQYTKVKCDKNGDLKETNMDPDIKEGLKTLKVKVK